MSLSYGGEGVKNLRAPSVKCDRNPLQAPRTLPKASTTPHLQEEAPWSWRSCDCCGTIAAISAGPLPSKGNALLLVPQVDRKEPTGPGTTGLKSVHKRASLFHVYFNRAETLGLPTLTRYYCCLHAPDSTSQHRESFQEGKGLHMRRLIILDSQLDCQLHSLSLQQKW